MFLVSVCSCNNTELFDFISLCFSFAERIDDCSCLGQPWSSRGLVLQNKPRRGNVIKNDSTADRILTRM